MTPIAISLAQRYGMIDYPDKRKIHHRPVPRGAGLVLWIGVALWALLFSPESFHARILVTGATVVFFAGYLDDMFPLSPFGRLAVQFAAALITLPVMTDQPFYIIILMIFWLVGVTNAFNFIDGMNGLSLSMAFLSMIYIRLISGSAEVMPVLGMIAGMFFWNFPKARTFVGDGGVYLLGYLTAGMTMFLLLPLKLGCFRLLTLLIFSGGVPVIDTLFVIIRRVLNGKSPFFPDRTHIHHRLLDKGLSQQTVLFVLCLLQILCMGTALTLYFLLTS